MNLDNNITQIILAIIALLGAVLGGTYYFKWKKSKNKQKDITIKGDKSRVTGGDDKSININ